MKKAFLCALAAISTCFAQTLRVTEIIDYLDLYILADTYVIKVDRKIPGVYVGGKITIDTDFFYNYDEWLQQIPITEKVLVGIDVEHKTLSNKTQIEELLDRDNSDLKKIHETTEKERYEYVTRYEQFRMVPVGVVYKDDYYDLIDFEIFLKEMQVTPLLVTYQSMDLDWGWSFTPGERPQTTPFTGSNESVWWVLNHMKSYTDEFTHTIRPIYNKTNTDVLVGALTHAVSYGWVMRDFEAYGLALLEDLCKR